MKSILTILFITVSLMANTQPDSSSSPLTMSGYIETYYLYDFNKPVNYTMPSFMYTNRHNEINLNLVFVKLAYQKKYTRANLAVATGTYINANYSGEQAVLKNLYEANAGVKLSKSKELWLDAGIFASHIGCEGAVGKDNWALTRSMLAENCPYFETGAKLSYTFPNGKWFINGLIMNGRQMRYFHNFYGIFQLSKQLSLTTGFDIGTEQKTKGSHQMNTWYSPLVILRLNTDSRNNIAARVEYNNYANGVIINTGSPDGFKTRGYSLNYDRVISRKCFIAYRSPWS